MPGINKIEKEFTGGEVIECEIYSITCDMKKEDCHYFCDKHNTCDCLCVDYREFKE